MASSSKRKGGTRWDKVGQNQLVPRGTGTGTIVSTCPTLGRVACLGLPVVPPSRLRDEPSLPSSPPDAEPEPSPFAPFYGMTLVDLNRLPDLEAGDTEPEPAGPSILMRNQKPAAAIPEKSASGGRGVAQTVAGGPQNIPQ